ncbi:hypothetical protein [Agrococcus versicolor]
MENLPLFLMMLIPALVVTITVAAMAPRLNAQWRERRAERAAASKH